MNKTLILISIIFITICGAFFRFHSIGDRDFISDELNHVYVAKGLIAQGEPALPSGKLYKRALPYSYLVKVSFELFGESEFSARIPSVLFSIILIPLIFITTRYFLDDEVVGLFAAVLFAFDPWSIIIATFSRMYSMLAFLYLLLILLFYKSIKFITDNPETSAHRKKNEQVVIAGLKWPYFILVIVLFYLSIRIHALAISFVAFAGSYLFYYVIQNYFKNAKGKLHKNKECFVITAVFLIVSIVILLLFKDQILGNFSLAWNYNADQLWWHLAGPLYYIEKSEKYFAWHPWILALIGGIYMFISGKNKLVFLSLSFFIPFILLSFLPLKGFRFIYHLEPVFLIFMSYSFINLFKWIVTKIRNIKYEEKTNFFVVSIIIMSLLWFSKGVMLRWKNSYEFSFKNIEFGLIVWPIFYGNDIEEIADYLRKNTFRDDLLASDYDYEMLYYFRKIDFHIPESGENIQSKSFYYKDGEATKYYYSGSVILENISDLRTLMKQDKKIWVIVHTPLLTQNGYKYDNFKEFLDQNYNMDFETADKRFRIYKWDKVGVNIL